MVLDFNLLIKEKIDELSEASKIKSVDLLQKEEFVDLVSRRLLISPHLENVLSIAIDFATELGHKEIVEVLSDNLKDEQGSDRDSSHKFWRDTFLQEIGVSSVQETTHNFDYDSFSFHQLLGMILYLEGSIPFESNKLKIARDQHFSDLSIIAKHYFDDHIIHDANDHFPRLIKAISNLNLQDSEQDEILYGVNCFHTRKMELYNS